MNNNKIVHWIMSLSRSVCDFFLLFFAIVRLTRRVYIFCFVLSRCCCCCCYVFLSQKKTTTTKDEQYILCVCRERERDGERASERVRGSMKKTTLWVCYLVYISTPNVFVLKVKNNKNDSVVVAINKQNKNNLCQQFTTTTI